MNESLRDTVSSKASVEPLSPFWMRDFRISLVNSEFQVLLVIV